MAMLSDSIPGSDNAVRQPGKASDAPLGANAADFVEGVDSGESSKQS